MMITLIVYVLIGLLLFSLFAYVVQKYVPLDDTIKKIIIGILALLFLLWLVRVFFWTVP